MIVILKWQCQIQQSKIENSWSKDNHNGPNQELKKDNSCTDREQPGFSFVGADIYHVHSVSVDARQDQAVPTLGRVSEAAGTGVPTRVVQLHPLVWHVQAVDDLHKDTDRKGRANNS